MDFEELAWRYSESDRLLHTLRAEGLRLLEIFQSPEMRDNQARIDEGKARLGVKGHATWMGGKRSGDDAASR